MDSIETTWTQEQQQGQAQLEALGIPLTKSGDPAKEIPCFAVFCVAPNRIADIVDLTVYLQVADGTYVALDVDWKNIRVLVVPTQNGAA